MNRSYVTRGLALALAAVLIGGGASFLPAGGLGGEEPRWVGSGVGRVEMNDVESRLTFGGVACSVDQSIIEAQVEPLAELPGIPGVFGIAAPTRIIEVVEEGTTVREGDILCRLDPSRYEEVARRQQIERDLARADLVKSELDLDVAKVSLTAYRDGERALLERQKRETLARARADLTRSENVAEWTRHMADLGYASAADLTRDEGGFLRAEVGLRRAEVDLETFLRSYDARMLRLLEVEVEKAETQLLFAKQRMELVENRLAAVQEQIEFCTMRAPHDGRVMYVTQYYGGMYQVVVGSVVYPKVGLFVLVDLDALEVEVEVHERFSGQIREGQLAEVTFDAFPGQAYAGEVRKIQMLPQTDWRHMAQWQNMVVRVKLLKSPPGLYPEMQGKVALQTSQAVVRPVIPAAAVVWDEIGPYCVARRHGGGWEQRRLKVDRGGPDRLVVVAGAEVGDEVLLAPRPVKAV